MDAENSSQTVTTLNKVCNLLNKIFSTITEGLTSSKYYSSCDISALKKSSGNLFILHVNIRSLDKNFDDLYQLISETHNPPHLSCISETRLKNDVHVNIEISGYQFTHVYSKTNAGGVGLYISDDIEFNHASSYSITANECENI